MWATQEQQSEHNKHNPIVKNAISKRLRTGAMAKKLNDGEELTFVQPTAKVAPTQASADEPVVREKKSAPPTPSTMESVLAEWAD